MFFKTKKIMFLILAICLCVITLFAGCQKLEQEPLVESPTSTPTPEPEPTRVYTPVELELKDKTDIKTPDLSGQDAKVLILGNSFVGSSEVGTILSGIAKASGESLSVEAVSEGFATISSLAHHITDNPKIKNGNYDAIFVCGVYSSDTAALQTFLDAVKDTKTKIILFPASNESPTDITNARIAHSGSGYVGWLDIIYELRVQEYFSTFSLIFDDDYLHINPLGGYAGALMIYNYLYREVPNAEACEQYMLQMYQDYVPGDDEAAQLKKLRKIATVAEELIIGTRPYRGQPTV